MTMPGKELERQAEASLVLAASRSRVARCYVYCDYCVFYCVILCGDGLIWFKKSRLASILCWTPVQVQSTTSSRDRTALAGQ